MPTTTSASSKKSAKPENMQNASRPCREAFCSLEPGFSCMSGGVPQRPCSRKQWPALWLLFQLMAVMKRILLVLACICLDLICRSAAFRELQEFDMLLHRNLAALYASGILCIDGPALDEAEALDFGDDERLQMGWRWKSWSAGAEANPCMAWNRRGGSSRWPGLPGGRQGASGTSSASRRWHSSGPAAWTSRLSWLSRTSCRSNRLRECR
jgi:hypothetical protein